MKQHIIIYCKEYRQQVTNQCDSKEQHLLGRKLLKQALIKEYQVEFSEDMIELKENGKPTLRELPIYFNISHCKGMVVCALSDGPVGIDVEAERKVSESLVEKTCNAWEKGYILNQDYTKSFLELWTLKESWMKMTGDGMRIPFDQVCFRFTEAMEDGWRTPAQISCSRDGYFYQKKLKHKYILSVCAEGPCSEPELKVITEGMRDL